MYDDSMASVRIVGGSVNVTAGDEVELLHAVYESGPVSICYRVDGDFRDYKTGVWRMDDCPSTDQDVNHAVVAVGFGTEDGMDYWLVKNSWGSSWGDKGFFKIQRGVNMCGVAMCNSYPVDIVPLTVSEFTQ